MYPDFTRKETRTIALIHNEYYQKERRYLDRGLSSSSKQSNKQNPWDRQKKMLSKKSLPRPKPDIINLSNRKIKKKSAKHSKKGSKRKRERNIKMYNPFSTSEDTEPGERFNPWSLRGEQPQETVNTAIVDIYEMDDKDVEHFLKIRVAVLACVFLIQFVSGISKSVSILNQQKRIENVILNPSQVCLPLHMHLLGGLATSLLLPIFLYLSRVRSLSVGCLLYFSSSLLTMFTTEPWMLRLSELLSGMGAGLSLPLVHLYSAEVFSSHRRIKMAVLIYLIEGTGELLATLTIKLFDVQAACLVCIFLVFPCLVCTTCVAQDSPRYLLWRGKKKECIDSLSWFRGHMSDIRTEFNQLSEYLSTAVGSSGVLESLSKRATLVPTVLALFIVILSSCIGVVTFNLIFVTKFSGNMISEEMTLIVNFLKICGSLGGLLIVSRYGLKMMLLLGFASSSSACLFLALLSHLTYLKNSWPSLISLSLLLFCHPGGIGSLLWLLIVELSPIFHTLWIIPLSSATFWASSLLQVMIFPLIMSHAPISLSVLSWAGSVSAAVSYVTILLFLPDLRKSLLGGMELHFKTIFDGENRRQNFVTGDDECSSETYSA